MSDKIRTSCPNCGKSLTVSAALIGRSGKCPACEKTFVIGRPTNEKPGSATQSTLPPVPPKPTSDRENESRRRPAPGREASLAQQPSHLEELSGDRRRLLAAVSAAPDKYALIEPYLMQYEQPVALAVQRQFPFSLFADIVLLTTHRLLVFKRFFTQIEMFDVNYVDFHDITVKQGFFTSTLTITTAYNRVCVVGGLITDQALTIYRMCQDIETKARMARRQFQLEENRSRTTTMQVNNLVAPPNAFPQSQSPTTLLPHSDISSVGDEERNPYRLGE